MRKESEKMSIEEAIELFAKRERDEAEKEKSKGKEVSISPDSYIVKELRYQTALLHRILNEVQKDRK